MLHKYKWRHCFLLKFTWRHNVFVFHLQCMSSLTEVEAGMERLLLVAWKINFNNQSNLWKDCKANARPFLIFLIRSSFFRNVALKSELETWQVRMEWRSSRRSWTSLNSLTTFDSNSLISSETSSNRAWSRHQLTRGWGRPVNKKVRIKDLDKLNLVKLALGVRF